MVSIFKVVAQVLVQSTEYISVVSLSGSHACLPIAATILQVQVSYHAHACGPLYPIQYEYLGSLRVKVLEVLQYEYLLADHSYELSACTSAQSGTGLRVPAALTEK